MPQDDATRDIDRLVCELVVDSVGGLDALFVETGSPPPFLRWNPREGDLGDERLRFLLSFWRRAARSGDLPDAAAIEPVALRPALGVVMLLEPIEAASDFRYRVYGTSIAAQSGIEMTGKRVSDIPSHPLALFFGVTYRAVLARREPLFARHATNFNIQIAQWDRLILPFVDERDAVSRLLVGNIPGPRTL